MPTVEVQQIKNMPVPPKYKILIVDDDLDLNTTFATLLEYDGHQVQAVDTGEAALMMLGKSQYDLMITEYWLPRMRGDELAALAKDHWPNLPVIIVAADIEEINTDEHPLHDVDCLLDKPFSIDQLREAIKWALSRNAPKEAEEMELHWVHSDHHTSAELPPLHPKHSGNS